MLKTFAIVFGIALVLVGILGFVPSVTPNGHLLGLFHVNALHNLIHLLSGFAALWCGFSSRYHSRLYFQIFGVIYALVAVLGFFYGYEPIFGIIANNIADAWLHVAIAAGALFLGFFYKD